MTRTPAIFAPAGPELAPHERDFFRAAAPWGFILFSRNLHRPGQVHDLCDALRDAVGYEAPILIDQEGGRVQRLRPPLARDWAPPLDDARRAGEHAAEALGLRYRIIAAELLDLGIDVNCAPVLDIARPDTHPFLRNRCYGETAREVIVNGRAVAGALMDGGVLPVMKHIPGHGRARADSHEDLPRVETAPELLDAEDFAPFRALADLPMAMTAHVVYAAIDERPATLSPVMIRLIRDLIGFQGLLMTDDISMQALSGTVEDRAVAALAAGCDLVLHCNGEMAEMQAIAESVPAITEEALQRGYAALAARTTPEPVDIPGLEAKLRELLDGREDDGD